MPSTTKTPGPFAERLKDARNATGLPLDVVSVRVRDMLGSDFGPSRETIRRYEDGTTTEDRADPVIVAAMADLYGVELRKLSAPIADQMDNVFRLAHRIVKGSTRTPARRKPNTRWSSDDSPARVNPNGRDRRTRKLARAVA